MENKKLRNGMILSIAVIATLLCSTLVTFVTGQASLQGLGTVTEQGYGAYGAYENLFPNQGLVTTPYTRVETDYGDPMQYYWHGGGYNESRTNFSPGPAPDVPNVLWYAAGAGSCSITGWGGKIFEVSGRTVRARNPNTGDIIWENSLESSARGTVQGFTWITDDVGFVETSNGMQAFATSDGHSVWNLTITLPNWGSLRQDRGPGAGRYWDDSYDSILMRHYYANYNTSARQNSIQAWDMSDPYSEPTLLWTYLNDESNEILCCGGGKVYVGNYAFSVYCLNGTNGEKLWETQRQDESGYSASYYSDANGEYVVGTGSSCRLTKYNANTGEVIWDHFQGGRAFFSYGGAIAYGRYYQFNIAVPDGWFACYDLETGEPLWKVPGYGNLAYWIPCVGDGKVYCTQSDGSSTSGRIPQSSRWTCWDAFTGTEIWHVEAGGPSYPTIVYGNLYARYTGPEGSGLYCIGTYDEPTDWAFWRGSTGDTAGTGQGWGASDSAIQSAPLYLNERWAYQTGGPMGMSSPTVADGKVFTGSADYNLYCLDAYNGTKIWNFTMGHKIYSQPAYYAGNVYTGADDGYIYCLDADTGQEQWKYDVYAGNVPLYQFQATWQPRSSPIIVNGVLYVGALDGTMYAINTANGGLKWKFETKDPLAYWDNNMSAIGGSPCYDNGKIFFNDINRKTYCLDAVTGAEIWEWITPWTSIASNANEVFHFGTPTVGGGRVYTGAGIQYQGLHFVALNETTGELIWNRSMGGNTQPVNTPAYQYVSPSDERIYFCESLSISCYNAANGHLLWLQFNGHQNFASPVFVNSLRGPVVYVGSDTYGISCYNATITTDRYDRFGALIAEASGGNGTTISTFDTEGEIDGSAALYDGMLYIGSADGKLYCLSDIPDVCLYMDAASSKGAGPMWSNETMTITGRLYTITTYTHYNQPGQPTDDYYVGIPYEDVLVTFTKPDGTSVDVPATTDNYGYFSVSYNPNAEGQWSWNAWFNGKDNVRDQLLYAYTEEAPVTVATPPTGGGGGGGGSAGTPVEYIYVAIAVIVIVLIAIGVYVFMRRRK